MLTVIQYPNPILSKRCEFVQNVDRDIRDLAWEMLQVLKSQEAVGLAANQVGHDKRMFLVDIWWPHTGSNENCLYFINPLIVPLQRGTQLRDEGCLSFPGVTAKVKRAEAISVTALGLDGQPFSMEAQGFLAVAIQHEFDHIEGKTFLDRIGTLERRIVLKQYRKNNA